MWCIIICNRIPYFPFHIYYSQVRICTTLNMMKLVGFSWHLLTGNENIRTKEMFSRIAWSGKFFEIREKGISLARYALLTIDGHEATKNYVVRLEFIDLKTQKFSQYCSNSRMKWMVKVTFKKKKKKKERISDRKKVRTKNFLKILENLWMKNKFFNFMKIS